MITAIGLDAAAGGGGGSIGDSAIAGDGGGARVPAPELRPFLKKCYEIVDDPATDATVSWGEKDGSFVIWDAHAFERDILPRYFKSDKFTSFVRQLNTYGFRKVDSDRWEFANEGFLRGQKHLLKRIPRKKPSHQSRGQESKEIPDDTHVKEIEVLKKDKDVLMQEIIELKQHQKSSDLELQKIIKCLEGMEHNQKQMLSFLAVIVQSPAFFIQILQQNDNNKWRMDANKKRRLPSPQHTVRTCSVMPSDGQLIKYQPRLTETLRRHPMQESSVPSNLQHVSDGINFSSNTMDVMPLGANISLTSESGVLLPSQQGFTSNSEEYSTDGPVIKYQPPYSQPLKQYIVEESGSYEADESNFKSNGMDENTVTNFMPHAVKSSIPSNQEISLSDYLEELLATPVTENSEQFEPQLVAKLMSDLYLPEN